MTISSPDVSVIKTDHMTHFKCGGLITLEQASARWKMSHSTGRVVKSDSEVTIGRCDRCGLAGIVCQAPR